MPRSNWQEKILNRQEKDRESAGITNAQMWMTGKSPQQTGNIRPYTGSLQVTPTDHSNYWMDKHNGTEEKIHNREEKIHSYL